MQGGGRYDFHEIQYFWSHLLYIHVQDGRTALYVASKNGHDCIVEELLKRQVDLNHQTKVRILLLCVFLQYSSIIMYSGPFLKVISDHFLWANQ